MATDYVTELADQAFREITAGLGQEIEKVVGESPTDAGSLAATLTSRPHLQAQVASLIGYTPSRWILEHELAQVGARRRNLNIDPVDPSGGPYKRAANSGLMGLCFSGGGIRSATFNLGILQGLAELKLLKCFDYLSTVSGGGYIEGWLEAWIKRKEINGVEDSLQPSRSERTLLGSEAANKETPEIHFLREYSNYLTPRLGLLGADTWTAVALYLGNVLLNQAMLILSLAALLLLPRLAAGLL